MGSEITKDATASAAARPLDAAPTAETARQALDSPTCDPAHPDYVITLQDCADIDRVFELRGDVLRVDAGRALERISIDGRTHYLKRYWWVPHMFWRRPPRRGLHELRMIQWLHKHGFRAPQVVARGRDCRGRFTRRVYFLMREVQGEYNLREACRLAGNNLDGLLADLAGHLARLHDGGFVHGRLHADDIRTSRSVDRWHFRHLDLEHARSDVAGHVTLAMRDLADLSESLEEDELRARLKAVLLRDYLAARARIHHADRARRWLEKHL